MMIKKKSIIEMLNLVIIYDHIYIYIYIYIQNLEINI